MDKINPNDLSDIRNYLINKLFRNPDFMFDEHMMKYDIPEIIAGLYEELHKYVLNEKYDYMFHWANKCGAWVETDYFIKKVREYNNEESI